MDVRKSLKNKDQYKYAEINNLIRREIRMANEHWRCQGVFLGGSQPADQPPQGFKFDNPIRDQLTFQYNKIDKF